VYSDFIVEPGDLPDDACLVDCRFSLSDPGQGLADYRAGHIPGARYMHLNRDLSGPVGRHGGRHPLPAPETFATTLAGLGIGPETAVVAYDDSRFAFASRLWWMMRALGYRQPRLLNGGYAAWQALGKAPETGSADPVPIAAPPAGAYSGYLDRDAVIDAQAANAQLVDAREPRRYQGLEEPIDPVAGHIPGAVNRPWQGVTDDRGRVLPPDALRAHFGELLDRESLVVYCGSGVTACVNLFGLALLGRDDPALYPGSWSDWCSYLVD
jgi:thiosulfate/3-mercaptopyruvate sulfurtransferase